MSQQPSSGSPPNPPPEGMLLMGSVAARTDVGRTRSNNEDNLVVFDLKRKAPLDVKSPVFLPLTSPGVLLAVADGMGGHNAGQVASLRCVEQLPAALLKALSPEGTPDWHEALVDAVRATNRSLYEEAQRDPELNGMGTTLTAACITGDQVWVAQVGDSRAYLLHEGRLIQLTQDQTVLNSLNPSERQAFLNSPLENMLLQAVGAVTEVDVVVTPATIAPNDRLLLCSDGLYRVVTSQQIVEILARPDSPEQKARALVAQANAGGGPDNITAILCEVFAGEPG